MNPFLMNIKDKINLPKTKACCPPHYIPHKVPFLGKPITDEPCHIHKAKWRMLHHIGYCIFLNCPHYKRMVEFNDKWKKKTTSSPTLQSPSQPRQPRNQ